MTIFYRQLALLDVSAKHVEAVSDAVLMEPLLGAYYIPEQLSTATVTRIGKWLRGYTARVVKMSKIGRMKRDELG